MRPRSKGKLHAWAGYCIVETAPVLVQMIGSSVWQCSFYQSLQLLRAEPLQRPELLG